MSPPMQIACERLDCTWQNGDISIIRDGRDYEKALKSVEAKGLIMPSKTNFYFPVSPTTDTIKAGGRRSRCDSPQRC
ncbi:hypothetical protein K503DRAFT_476359 [Rhizopogon vinicolor AM-OR11-026]|uniref:Uncharacterized protein n=1 Tax=Rhizopogon vinicolor AM-OR11-026 TaxID=1314800 RepID=A0A1B7N9T7_9AGAM|nr:hypothetical protein K503DRAFT_476359 [Rhizopogon vinicolor AM-OR11-026]